MINPDTRIAFIYKDLPQMLGYGGYLERGVKKLCQTTHFLPGEETKGFDQYFYIDDGPTDYMEPKYHPASYFAIDMVVKPFWYLQPVEIYFERLQNFDYKYVSSTATLRYCLERGVDVRLVGFAADPEMHRPLDFSKDRDWVAVWHNCGDRVEASRRAYERYPNGQVVWGGESLYAAYISRGRCALNWLRGDIVNMRVFEVMACRVPLVTTRHEDMGYYGFIENEHYLGYEGVDEMLDRIDWVQTHQLEAEQIAIKAWHYVLANHTYRHRAIEVLG